VEKYALYIEAIIFAERKITVYLVMAMNAERLKLGV
jgi:hypothetical protein